MSQKPGEVLRFNSGGSEASDSSAELARRWRLGEVSAFEKLVQRYAGPLLSYAFSRVRHLQDGEDIVQETLLRAHRSIHQLKDDRQIWLWLKQIAHNAAFDAMKRARRYAIPTDPQDIEDLGNRMEPGRRPSMREIVEAIESLPETYRQTAVYYYLEEWPYSRIAEALDLDPVAVRQRISRVNKMLRESFGRKS